MITPENIAATLTAAVEELTAMLNDSNIDYLFAAQDVQGKSYVYVNPVHDYNKMHDKEWIRKQKGVYGISYMSIRLNPKTETWSVCPITIGSGTGLKYKGGTRKCKTFAEVKNIVKEYWPDIDGGDAYHRSVFQPGFPG